MNLATGQVLHDTRRRHAGDDVLAFFKLIDLHVPRHLDVHVVLDNLFLVLPVPLALVVVEAGSAILGGQFLQMGIVDDGVAGAAGQTDGRRGAGVERQPAGIGIGNDRWAGRVSRGDDATLDDADRTRRTGTPRPGSSTLCAARLVTMQRVPATTNAKISHRGQTSLPADLRHRWGLDDGGDIGFIDLGEAALIVPGGTGPGTGGIASSPRRSLRQRSVDHLRS